MDNQEDKIKHICHLGFTLTLLNNACGDICSDARRTNLYISAVVDEQLLATFNVRAPSCQQIFVVGGRTVTLLPQRQSKVNPKH